MPDALPTTTGTLSERCALLEEALSGIRGAVLGRLSDRESLKLINEIVGEALYGDFPGTLVAAYDEGQIEP